SGGDRGEGAEGPGQRRPGRRRRRAEERRSGAVLGASDGKRGGQRERVGEAEPADRRTGGGKEGAAQGGEPRGRSRAEACRGSEEASGGSAEACSGSGEACRGSTEARRRSAEARRRGAEVRRRSTEARGRDARPASGNHAGRADDSGNTVRSRRRG